MVSTNLTAFHSTDLAIWKLHRGTVYITTLTVEGKG